MLYILYQALLSQVCPGFVVASEVPKCSAAIQSWSICAFRSQAGRLWGGEEPSTPVYSSFMVVSCCETLWPVPFLVCGGPELPVAQGGLWLTGWGLWFMGWAGTLCSSLLPVLCSAAPGRGAFPGACGAPSLCSLNCSSLPVFQFDRQKRIYPARCRDPVQSQE